MSKLYTNLANVYHEIYQTLFDYDEEFKFYDEHLRKNGVAKVLEVGCGTGNLAKRLLDAKYDYWGIDLFDEMLEIAKQTAPNAKFSQADVRNFDLNSQFDCTIVTGRSISYLIENNGLLDALNCIKRNLKVGGMLMFDAIDAEKMFENFENEKVDELEVKYGVNDYQRKSKSRKNLSSGWTWDWESEYFKKDSNGVYKKIGEDFSTLRAFLKEELALFLKLRGFQLIEVLPKKSYAWDDNFFIARKVS